MNYFIHDSNARSDERILKLRMAHGAAGYGVYFMLLELMRDSSNYMCLKDYNTIAFELRVDAALVKAVVENYGLFTFTNDGKCFYSTSFSDRMRKFDSAHRRRVNAGRKGGTIRWGKDDLAEDFFADLREPESRNSKSVCRKFSLTHTQVSKHLDAFLLDCQCRGSAPHKNKRDALAHFTDWLRINIEAETINSNSNEARKANARNDRRRGVQETAHSVQDYQGAF